MAAKKSNNQSILKKFLLINFVVFLIIGILTLFYLNTVKPTLIKNKTSSHIKIIDNTTQNIERLKINFTIDEIREFLFSTKFLFQSIDRVQIFDSEFNLLGDTDIEDRTIDSHVKRIRKKFKKVDNNFSAIETRYGSGYRWNVK